MPNIDVDTVVPETPPLALVESTATPTCDASAPPDNGGVGDCTSALAAGSSCQPTCNSGYTVTGVTTCVAATSEHEDNAFKWTQSDTTLTAAKCVEVTCDASAAPANGDVGTCTSAMAAGSTCQPTCNSGYQVSGVTSCSSDGTLTAATCDAITCDASAAPANGEVGDCTSAMAAGSTCQPTCNSGYTVSGVTTCASDGTLTAATCGATCHTDGLWYYPLNQLSDGTTAARTVETPASCQQRCKDTSGCLYWLNFPNGGCHLTDGSGGSGYYSSNPTAASGAVDCT